MDGERKFVLLMVGVIAVCITILYVLLFVSLWPYRGYVGASLLALLILVVVVYARGKFTEQNLRHVRYHHHTETPLDGDGEPRYWHEGMQVNPHRLGHLSPSASRMPQPKQPYLPYESGYQSSGGEDEWTNRPL